MKTKSLSFVIGFLCSLALLAGCKDDNKNITPEPPAPTGPQNVTITTSGLVYDGFTATITPKDDKITYYCSYVEKRHMDDFDTEAEYISSEVLKIQAAATQSGLSFAEFVVENGMVVSGKSELAVLASIDANTEYCVYAYLLDADGNFSRTMDKVFFTTPAAPAASMRDDATLSLSLTNLGAHAFGIAMHCLDPLLYVFTGYTEIANYEKVFGGEPQGIVDYVEAAFAKDAKDQNSTLGSVVRTNCLQGSQLFGELMGAPSSTSYIAYAIGFDSQGRRVTDIATLEYATLEEVVGQASVTLTPGKYYDGDELYAIDAQKYASYKDKAYAFVHAEPNAEAANWYIRVGKAAGLKDQPDDLLKDLLLQKGTQNKTDVVFAAEWDVDYLLLGVALDADEQASNLVKVISKCLKSGVSPISDITGASAPANVFELIGSQLVNSFDSGASFELKLKAVEKINIRR